MSCAAAFLDRDVDRRRAGVERVLDQLLDGGRGPLDHLAGGDLVSHGRGKHCDARHRRMLPDGRQPGQSRRLHGLDRHERARRHPAGARRVER